MFCIETGRRPEAGTAWQAAISTARVMLMCHTYIQCLRKFMQGETILQESLHLLTVAGHLVLFTRALHGLARLLAVQVCTQCLQTSVPTAVAVAG